MVLNRAAPRGVRRAALHEGARRTGRRRARARGRNTRMSESKSGGTRQEKIAVIGAGQMGNGIAHVFAQSGFAVTMIDVAQGALDKGKGTIEKNLDRQVKKGTIDAAAKDATLGRI